MPNLIYPHAFLFAYHLRSPFDDIGDRDKIIWKKLSDLGKIVNYEVKGSHSTRHWDDAIGLFLGCAIEEEKIAPDRPCFPELRDRLICNYESLKPDGEFLGKTLGFAGYVSDSQDAENYAKAVYKSLELKDLNLEDDSVSVAQLDGATAFEIWRSPQNWNKLEAENQHILILVFDSSEAMKKIVNLANSYRDLFCYRHKITWSYAETRSLKERLSGQIQQTFSGDRSKAENLLKSNLGDLKMKLKESLVELTDYSKDLNNLAVQKQTIATNLHNYDRQLKKLQNADSDRFSDMVKFYQLQIKSDYAALSPGLQLREKWLDTIRGMVEIQQVEADRNLEETIAIVGVGIGASSIAASLSSTYVAEIRQIPIVRSYLNFWELTPTQANLVVAVNVSIWTGIVVGGFLGCIIWIGKKWRSR